MPAPDSLHQLVRRFEEHLDSYRSGRYNETQLRREIESTDVRIDRLVYELPKGLTDDEIRVVEGS